MTKPPKPALLRRSTRLDLRVPVVISGKLADGKPFKEEASIVTISKHGAKLATKLPLKVGMQVKVQPRRKRESALFRVVWIGRDDTPRSGEVGVECAQLTNLLGVNFPD